MKSYKQYHLQFIRMTPEVWVEGEKIYKLIEGLNDKVYLIFFKNHYNGFIRNGSSQTRKDTMKLKEKMFRDGKISECSSIYGSSVDNQTLWDESKRLTIECYLNMEKEASKYVGVYLHV